MANVPGYKGNGHNVVSLVSPIWRANCIAGWERRRSIVLTCKWCGWVGNGRQIGAYKRYHDERCKKRIPDPVGPESEPEGEVK